MRPETGVKPSCHREEHDEQQAPPEDRHGIADQRHASSAPGRRQLPRLTAATRRPARRSATANSMAKNDSSSVAGNSVRNSVSTFCWVTSETPKSPCSMLPDIVEELPPDRLVEAEFVAEHRQPLGRDAVLADAHLDRIARHQPDRHEGQEHQRDEGRDRQRDAAEEIDQHGGAAEPSALAEASWWRHRPQPRVASGAWIASPRRMRTPAAGVAPSHFRSTPSNACVPSGLCL